MKNNYRLSLRFLSLICVFFSLPIFAAGENHTAQVDFETKCNVVDSIVSQYFNWGRVSLSGKITSDQLPIPVNLKIYMEKDSLTVISLSAFLVGELGRVEIDSENAVIVNNIGKTFTKIPRERIDSLYSSAFADMQNMILGRIVIPSSGVLRKINVNDVEVFGDMPDKWVIEPADNLKSGMTNLIYMVNRSDYKLSDLIIADAEGSFESICLYSWKDLGGYNIDFDFNMKGKNVTGALIFSAPSWGAQAIDRFSPDSRWREVLPSQFMKSML